MKPIKPDEILDNRENIIHPNIFVVINDMLKKKYTHYNTSVDIKQNDIIKAFLEITPDFKRQQIFDEHHLDFEEVYRQYGWSVKFDQPGWDENYDTRYTFTKKK